MGDREVLLLRACSEIEKLIGPIKARSAFIESAPWGFESDHAFLNGVVWCTTELEPLQILDCTQAIERMLGKRNEHSTKRRDPQFSIDETQKPIYHDRPIDIDILLIDSLHIHESRLTVPHPLMKQRSFVMVPLLELLQNKDGKKYLSLLSQTTW